MAESAPKEKTPKSKQAPAKRVAKKTAAKAPAKPRKTAAKKAPVRRAAKPAAESKAPEQSGVAETATRTRKAPTNLAAQKNQHRQKHIQLAVIGFIMLVGVGASAAVGYTDQGQINVTQVIEERNQKTQSGSTNNQAGESQPVAVPVQNTSKQANGGLVGRGTGGRKPQQPPPAAAASSTVASSTASSTDSTASSTDQQATSSQAVADTTSSSSTAETEVEGDPAKPDDAATAEAESAATSTTP